MNRGSIFALMGAMVVALGLCALVPQVVSRTAAAPVAGETEAAQPTVLATGSAPASYPILSASPEGTVAHIRERADQTQGKMVYVLLLAVLILSGLGLPIPEEIPLMLAGYKAWHGAANLYLLIPVGLFGVLVADTMLFLAARYWRSHIFRLRLIRATIRPRHLMMARTHFHNHGMKIVILARWLPALRTAVCLTAGLTGVSVWRFLLVDATAACITVPTSVLLGYIAANQIDRLLAAFQSAEHTALLIILVAIAAVVIYWMGWGRHKYRRVRRPKTPRLGSAETATDESSGQDKLP